MNVSTPATSSAHWMDLIAPATAPLKTDIVSLEAKPPTVDVKPIPMFTWSYIHMAHLSHLHSFTWKSLHCMSKKLIIGIFGTLFYYFSHLRMTLIQIIAMNWQEKFLSPFLHYAHLFMTRWRTLYIQNIRIIYICVCVNIKLDKSWLNEYTYNNGQWEVKEYRRVIQMPNRGGSKYKMLTTLHSYTKIKKR